MSEASFLLATRWRAQELANRWILAIGFALVFEIACGGSTAPSQHADAGGASDGSQGDAAFPDSCAPKCAANACDVDDTCGGVCSCAPGVACIAGTCGGCVGLANDYCVTSGPADGSVPATCCGIGDECKFYGDAYRCCAIKHQGGCVRDTDCCDFSSGARCNSNSDAGPIDAGTLPGVCQ